MQRSATRGRLVFLLPICLSILLGGCLGTSPTSSTPERATTEQQETITFWTPFSGGDISFMSSLVQQYNEENIDHITVIMKNMKSDDYYTKLSTAIVTEEGPDVAIVHASKFAQFVPAGFITDISSIAEKSGVEWKAFNPNILERTLTQGKHYGIPLDTHFSVLYYNKKWLKEASLYQDGHVVMQPGEAGFMDFLKKLQSSIPPQVAPLAVPNVRIDSLWLWWSLYSQMNGGGKLFTADGKKADIQMEDAQKSLQFVANLYQQKLIPPGINDATAQFAKGQAATLFLGVWAIGSFEKVIDLDFGVIPFPQIYDKPGSWGDSHTFAFPAHSKDDPAKLEAAVKFANWVSEHGAVWAKAGHIPAVTSAVQSQEFQSLPIRKDYAEAANDVAYFPNHSKQGEVTNALVEEFEKLWYGKQSVDELLKKLKPMINSILED